MNVTIEILVNIWIEFFHTSALTFDASAIN